MLAMRSNTSSCIIGDRPADGSSSSSTDGSIISARAIASIWRSPPDSEPARWSQPLAEPRQQPDDVVAPLAEFVRPQVRSPCAGCRRPSAPENTLLTCGT